MTMRKACARWRAPTHALVTFDEENTNSVVPIILINGGRGDRKDGEKCEVMWPNDKKMYSGTVVALYIHYQLLLICNQQVTLCAGTEQEMNTILDDNGKGEDSDDGSSESSGTDEYVSPSFYTGASGRTTAFEELMMADSTNQQVAEEAYPSSEGGEYVGIDGILQGRVIACEFMAKTPEKMALNLIGLFFTKDQLRKGNCTPTISHKEILDHSIINGIRLHMKFKYPAGDQEERKHWKAVLSNVVPVNFIHGDSKVGNKCLAEQSRIVAGAIDKEHLELLERVLRCLDSYNLTLHKKKCAFFQKEITYCGYRVDGEGLQKTPERSRAVVDAPSLGNLSQLRAFLDKLLPQVSSRSVNTAGTLTSSTTDKYIYGHVWNELGSEGAPKKIIINGLGMENAIGTSKWWFRLMCTIFGMIKVDTFKTFCHLNWHIQVPSHRNFIERLVIMLLTNSKSGAPEPTPFQLQLRKRKRNDSGEDEDSDVECAVEHAIMSITQYLNARDSGSKASNQNSLAGQPAKRRNSKEVAKEHRALHGTAVRCKVCPKPAPNANFCCVQCSNEMDGRIFGVCGPKSGRICSQIHQKRMWTI
eukprot:Em0026g7a